jgi:hypothetical protein
VFAQLEDLQDFLSLEDVESVESPLHMCLLAADAYIKTYTNRTLESTRFNQFYTPMSPYEILLPEFPLTMVHGITAMQSLTDTTGFGCSMDFVKFRKSGWVYSGEGIFMAGVPQSVQVEYTAGYTEADPEYETLKWLSLEIAGQLFRGRGMMNILDYQSGGAQITKYDFKVGSGDQIIGMLGPEIVTILGMFAVRGPRSIDA